MCGTLNSHASSPGGGCVGVLREVGVLGRGNAPRGRLCALPEVVNTNKAKSVSKASTAECDFAETLFIMASRMSSIVVGMWGKYKSSFS